MQPRPRRIDSPISSSSSSSSFPFLFHFIPSSSRAPFRSSPILLRDFRPFPSLSLSLSLFRGYDHTLCTARHRHPQGGHSFVWYSTLTTRHFRADLRASLVPTACISARVCVVHGYEERIRSLASILPAGIYVRTYVRGVHRGKCFYGTAEGPAGCRIKFASMAGCGARVRRIG